MPPARLAFIDRAGDRGGRAWRALRLWAGQSVVIRAETVVDLAGGVHPVAVELRRTTVTVDRG
ncbi:MAG: hypothetical protein U0R78_05390 [Nocardioidaceae bacterium]